MPPFPEKFSTLPILALSADEPAVLKPSQIVELFYETVSTICPNLNLKRGRWALGSCTKGEPPARKGSWPGLVLTESSARWEDHSTRRLKTEGKYVEETTKTLASRLKKGDETRFSLTFIVSQKIIEGGFVHNKTKVTRYSAVLPDSENSL